MKQKNNTKQTKDVMGKKAQGQIITTILIILLVLSAIVIVWQVVERELNKVQDIEFNITREGCWNKIYADAIMIASCKIGCFYPIKEGNISLTEVKQMQRCSNNCDEIFNYSEEVCEQVEVDKIIINEKLLKLMINQSKGDELFFKNLCKDLKGEYGVYSENPEQIVLTCTDYTERVISKKDLTIEWLENNCAMILKNKEQFDASGGDSGFINSFKCKDYYIEVIK